MKYNIETPYTSNQVCKSLFGLVNLGPQLSKFTYAVHFSTWIEGCYQGDSLNVEQSMSQTLWYVVEQFSIEC